MQDSQPRRQLALSEEDQAQFQLMQETHLLVKNMAEREQATVKAILDSLYEVGSVRLINQKVSTKILRGPLKRMAHVSKPVFRLFAWRWFKRNCPQLVTNWLFTQVQFGDRSLLIEQDDSKLIDVAPVRKTLPPIVEKQAKEIMALRGRIALLTGIVVCLACLVCFNLLA
ncbi:MAG: hypothetical protein AAFO87_01610 [Cyanobacteria bacterium J06607_6]